MQVEVVPLGGLFVAVLLSQDTVDGFRCAFGLSKETVQQLRLWCRCGNGCYSSKCHASLGIQIFTVIIINGVLRTLDK